MYTLAITNYSNATILHILVLTLIMCYCGIFKQTALAINLFLSCLDCPAEARASFTYYAYIYTSIIQPKIGYAISIWGYTTAHNINKFQRLQNRAARILTGNYDYVNTRGIALVKTLGLINVSQRRDYFMIMLMFKSIHGLVPNYLCDEITMQRDIAERTTKSTIDNNVHVPHITLECFKNAFCYRGPVLWNTLPENIKKCESLNGFKQCLKLHVVELLMPYLFCIYNFIHYHHCYIVAFFLYIITCYLFVCTFYYF